MGKDSARQDELKIMAEFLSYRCDECGRTKGESNHWFRLFRVPGPRVTIVPWDLPKRDERAEEKHLCGMACAMKAITKELEAMNEG